MKGIHAMLTLTNRVLRHQRTLTFSLALAAIALCADAASAQSANRYRLRKLVSDGSVSANHTDDALVNPWGIAVGDTGPLVVANNGTGTATFYNKNGGKQPTEITIPAAPGSVTAGSPTGVVLNATNDFIITDGTNSEPAQAIFVSLDGVITAWNPNVGGSPSTEAQIVVDNSGSGSVYTGVALGTIQSGGQTLNRLYVANFGNGTIDVYGEDFNLVNVTGTFHDNRIPNTFAPFNIANLNGHLFVAYAKANDEGEEITGLGKGFVVEYDTNGHLLDRLVRRGNLNAPWGMSMAPSNFGRFSNMLLVGNFGNGRINAYDPDTGQFKGAVRGTNGKAIKLEGLWGMSFGNGDDAGPTNTLFFASGPDDETGGLFGSIRKPASSSSETAADSDDNDSE
jgi:uncharacterized protein (TIGR03118 family)